MNFPDPLSRSVLSIGQKEEEEEVQQVNDYTVNGMQAGHYGLAGRLLSIQF